MNDAYHVIVIYFSIEYSILPRFFRHCIISSTCFSPNVAEGFSAQNTFNFAHVPFMFRYTVSELKVTCTEWVKSHYFFNKYSLIKAIASCMHLFLLWH